MTIGQTAPTDPVNGLARTIAGLAARIADLERARPMILADHWWIADLNGGTATSPTVFATAYDLLDPAPFDLTMTVTAFAHVGFSTASPGLQMRTLNQAGTNITKNSDGYAYADLSGSRWIPMTVMGACDYAAGDTVGCALSYAVVSNNAYVRAGVRVQFARR